MRWERLFADLEAQIDALALEDRDYLVEELVDETWSVLRWRDLLGGHVEIEVAGHGVVSGRTTIVNEHVVCLETPVSDIYVRPAAVMAVLESERRAEALSAVGASLQWSRVWRSLRETGEEFTMTRMDGSQTIGAVDQAGGDFVIIRTHQRRILVTNESVALISCRR